MKKTLAIFGFVLMVFAASPATATTLTYAITSDHCTGGCATPGNTIFGYVVLTDGLFVDTVHVNVFLLNGNKWVDTGAADAFDFNVASNPEITVSNITTASFAAGLGYAGGLGYSVHADGTGYWMYSLACPACGTGGATPQTGPLNFDVSAPGINVYSFTENPNHNIFAMDMISGTTGRTGAVDVSTPPVVPDGGMTVSLLGMALAGMGLAFRRMK